jgi:amidase
LHEAYERDSTDHEIVQIFMRALDDLRRAGATVVDPATVEGLEIKRQTTPNPCMGFKYDLNHFLADRSGQVPVADLAAILKSGKFHPSTQKRLEDSEKGPENGPDSEACQADAAYREQFRESVAKTMERLKLDAFVYPTWSNPPRLIGDLNTPAGDNSQVFSPTTGFPAINVPMGYSRGGTLPVGITFYGRAWSDAQLIKLAYAYEQATLHRRPPASTPPLR